MNEKYFVLATEHFFGVFSIRATWYPDEFLYNLSFACVKERHEIMPYLINKVGRNALIRSGFKDKPESIGKVYMC